jgi:hypothetical protein
LAHTAWCSWRRRAYRKEAGRKAKYTEAERLNMQLMKRNAELERKLHIANVLIELQKKAHEILGLALPESDGET